jgi:hypothetical protein
MRFINLRTFVAAAIAASALVLSGCATTRQTTQTVQAPQPLALSIGDVAKLIGDKKTDVEIVKEIQTRGLKSPANAADLDVLLKQGASKDVIDAVLIAQNGPTNQQQTTTTTQYGYPPVYSYGYPAYGLFSWGWGGGYYGGYRSHGYVNRGPVIRAPYPFPFRGRR